MADVRKTIEVAYQADVTQLLGNLKKIPGMTDKEAKKMVQALSTQLRQTEKAAKKAAQTNSKAMKQMGNSAKQTRKQFQQMKRSASQMGAGLGELSSLAGESDSAIGQMANNAGLFAMSASALLPLLGGLKGAVMSLGASAAMATGGLTLVVGGIAALAMSMSSSSSESDLQRQKIGQLEGNYKKLSEKIQTTITKNAAFRKEMLQTVQAVDSLQSELESQTLELNFQLGVISEKEYQEQIKEMRIAESNKRIAKKFDERAKAVKKALLNEEGAAKDLMFQLIQLDELLGEQGKKKRSYFSYYSDLQDLDKLSVNSKFVVKQNETLEQTQQRISKLLGQRPKRYIEIIARLKQQQALESKARNDFNKFSKERATREEVLQEQAIENIRLEQKLANTEKSKANRDKAKAKRKEKELQEEQRLAQIAGQRQQLSAALFNLEKDKASEIEKINMDIDKQIAGLQTLAKENKKIATDQTEQLDITKAVSLLEEKRKQQIDEVNQKIKEQGNIQQQNKDKQAINDLIQGYKNQEISLSDLYDMENELRNNKETAETALHLKVMEMIAAEHNARLQGSKELLGNLQTFTQARLTMIQNTEDADQKAITRAFYLNQAASAASVAFTTSENIVKALGMAATNPILAGALAATATAAGAAQIGAIMSTPPPQKKHMGGMANDERNFTLLQGEAVLSRAAARRIGEQGIRRIEDGKSMNPEVVVISPFKHYDRFVSSRNRRVKTKTVAAGGY